MSYSDEIKKSQQEPFAELFRFKIGENIDYYTSYSKDIAYDGNIYLARPIKRGELSNTKKVRDFTLKITAPLDGTLRKYIANSPSEPVYVQIIRVYLTSAQDHILLFKGEIINVTVAGYMAHVDCESRTQVFRNKIPNIVFQSRCNHTVFNAGCKLLEQNYKVPAIVNVSNSDLISTTFTGYTNDYFTGGHVQFEKDLRMITGHTGNTINLQIPFDNRVSNGSVIAAYPGCDGSIDTCKNKYNNYDNFLGFPNIPSSNPVIWGFK